MVNRIDPESTLAHVFENYPRTTTSPDELSRIWTTWRIWTCNMHLYVTDRCESKSRFIQSRFGDIGLKLNRPCFLLFAKVWCPTCLRSIEEGDSMNPKLLMMMTAINGKLNRP